MSPVNGHANESTAQETEVAAASLNAPVSAQFNQEKIKLLVARLEVPFHPSVIEWRVTNTSKNGSARGQVIPYADQRAYTDRLNTLFTPAGWTREYAVHTSANFERSKDKKIVAKILVTCKLTIFELGSHSATGEEFADDENAGTAAEAQAFKRACACFGLGRYLYYFSGEWVDLDDRKRPKRVPKLPTWATPEGWQQGLRPRQETSGTNSSNSTARATTGSPSQDRNLSRGDTVALVREIEALAEPLGKGIYRGLLKTLAHAWKPSEIREPALLQKVLLHMQAAERGLRRLDAALNILGTQALQPVLRDLRLRSLDQVDNLETLKKIVLALEDSAAKVTR